MSPTAASSAPESVTDRVERAVEALIEERGLAVGDRLPSERALSDMLGASRNSLREALMRLAARGRVIIRKGGNVIAEPATARWANTTINDPLTPVVAGNPGFGQDVLEVRRGLEGQAAYHAALRATREDIDLVRRCVDTLAEAHDKGDAAAESHADAAFHLAIADASHNAVLRSVMSSMFGLLQSSISQASTSFTSCRALSSACRNSIRHWSTRSPPATRMPPASPPTRISHSSQKPFEP